ncbi:MAG: phosphoenolpyruvate carboxylase [Crenarchaeota archaeon]|nr:phosphoenolpyruvate carboxylase [Thermoproteota archaeon]
MLKLLGVPFAMATQHPDSASRRITAQGEVEEAVNDLLPLSRGGYGCDEKMVDYEGKLTPYHQPQWIVEALARVGLKPGEDYLITPRIPAERLESGERQVMVIWSSLVANKHSIPLGGQAVKYMIHPMTGTSRELVAAQRRITKLEKFAEEELGLRLEEPIKIIPLVEDVVRHFHVDKLMHGLHYNVARTEGLLYDSYRILLGKSDAALSFGHLASTISLITAISRLYAWGFSEKVRVYPILGVGKPPFRGHLAPETVEEFTRQYSGYFTVTIQSALRFDTPRKLYEETIEKLAEGVGGEPRRIPPDLEPVLAEAARHAAAEYLRFLLRAADRIVEVARLVPSKRDRMPMESYSRDVSQAIAFTLDKQLISLGRGRIPLPRAIKFTAACYTMGIPPGLIGLGRGLRRIRERLGGRILEEIIELAPLLRLDVEYDTAYMSPELAKTYLPESLVEEYMEDARLAADILGVGEPEQPPDEYFDTLWRVRECIKEGPCPRIGDLIDEAGAVRGFLG